MQRLMRFQDYQTLFFALTFTSTGSFNRLQLTLVRHLLVSGSTGPAGPSSLLQAKNAVTVSEMSGETESDDLQNSTFNLKHVKC